MRRVMVFSLKANRDNPDDPPHSEFNVFGKQLRVKEEYKCCQQGTMSRYEGGTENLLINLNLHAVQQSLLRDEPLLKGSRSSCCRKEFLGGSLYGWTELCF